MSSDENPFDMEKKAAPQPSEVVEESPSKDVEEIKEEDKGNADEDWDSPPQKEVVSAPPEGANLVKSSTMVAKPSETGTFEPEDEEEGGGGVTSTTAVDKSGGGVGGGKGGSADWDEVDEVEVKKKMHTDIVTFWSRLKQEALQASVPTAPWHTHKYKSYTYSHILTGVEVADWLVENNWAEDHTVAQSIGQAMINREWIYHMKKKRESEGFKVDEKFWFSLRPITNEEQGNRLSRMFKDKEVNYGPPVAYRKEGKLVTAIIVERQRRLPAEDGSEQVGPFSPEGLKEDEPNTMSCEMADVPLPSCEDVTPDGCEWMTEWVVEDTDENAVGGWMYADKFGIDHDGWVKDESEKTIVRKRHWIRTARKRPERRKEDMKKKPEFEEDSKIGEDHDTMLSKMATATVRQPRVGFMEILTERGEGLWKLCDSFITVECRDTKDKSAPVSKRKAHAWDHKSFITMKSDLDPIYIKVFQNAGKKPCLGVAEFFIPEDEVGGERVLRLKPPEDDKSAQLAGYSASQLGSISIVWQFNVDGAGSAALQLNGADGGLQRCVFSLNVLEGIGLNADRKRFGPCGAFSGGNKASKVFLRLTYKGEFTEMVTESKAFSYKPDMEFDWKTSVDCSPAHPVNLELWGVGLKQPTAKMHFEFTGDEEEKEEEKPLRSVTQTVEMAALEVSEEAMASAGGNFGQLKIKHQWQKLKSNFEELVDAKEEVLANEGQGRGTVNMLKWW